MPRPQGQNNRHDMGYIQFDKVNIPQDNLVSLGLLNKQLQKLKDEREQALQVENDNDKSSSVSGQGISSTNFNLGSLDEFLQDEKFGFLLQGVSPSQEHGIEETNNSSGHTTDLEKNDTDASEFWNLFMSEQTDSVSSSILPSSLSNQSSIFEPSLDEEICGLRFNTMATTNLSSPPSTLSSNTSTLSPEDRKLLPTSLSETSCRTVGTSSTSYKVHKKKHMARSIRQELIALSPELGAVHREIFQCPHCPSNFKVKGYLTRHLKKHLPNKDYHCPYWSPDCKCHTTGEFSRKDTFKTHLKSIHFVYPVGVVKSQRSYSKGRCAACFQEFESNVAWLNEHIETGICRGLFEVKNEEQ